MLSNDTYYHGTVEKVVAAFGSIFNNIHIHRTYTTDPSRNQMIKVPLAYGPREKFRMRLEQDPNAGIHGEEQPVQLVLPRMSFQMTGMSYDDRTKLATTVKHAHIVAEDASVLLAQFQPVPYRIDFELVIMIKNVRDGFMIVEQIIPFFSPDYTITIKDIPQLSLNKDLPVVLTNISTTDTYDGPWTERRAIEWSLGFSVRTQIYPPIKIRKVTTEAKVRYYLTESERPFQLDTTVPFEIDSNALTVVGGSTTTSYEDVELDPPDPEPDPGP